MTLERGNAVQLNEWSFSQMCRLSGVSKETINRLLPDTASRAFRDTLPHSDKPIQLLKAGQTVRSVYGVSYTRLGIDADEVAKELSKHDTPQSYIKDALEIARSKAGSRSSRWSMP